MIGGWIGIIDCARQWNATSRSNKSLSELVRLELKEFEKVEMLGVLARRMALVYISSICRRSLNLLPCGLGANLPGNDIFGSPYWQRQGSKCRSKHPIINRVLLSCELDQISCPCRDGVNFPRRNISKSGNIPRICGETNPLPIKRWETTHIKHT